MKTMLSILASFAMVGIGITPAFAFPERPVTIVVGAGAGGNIDTVARIVADELSGHWGKPVIVSNKSGAHHTIGATFLKQSRPDGYTLMLINSVLTYPSDSKKNAGIDPLRDFAPIANLSRIPNALAINAKADKFATMKEWLASVKNKEPPATYASSGVSGTNFETAIKLATATGAKFRPVIYGGGSEQVLALLRGEVDFIANGSCFGQAKEGKVRLLAVTTKDRLDTYPDVPTIAEALGIPGFDVYDWHGIVAPAGTPKEILAQIANGLKTVSKNSRIQERFRNMNGVFAVTDPDAFASFLAERVKMGEDFFAKYGDKQ